jgi:hypothetical protein
MEKHMNQEYNIKLSREDLIIITMGLSNLIAKDSISINEYKELLRTKKFDSESQKKSYKHTLKFIEIEKSNYVRVLEDVRNQYLIQKKEME